MSLLDGQPLEESEWQKRGVTYKDKKARAYRRRPYWIDLGKGPEGWHCKDCRFLTKRQYAKTYYKCGLWPITNGPGTQIATSDEACQNFGLKGLPMLTVKLD